MFIFSFMLVCIDSFIDSFIADETMENLRRKRWGDEEMLEEKLEKLTAQPSFKQFKIFNKSLVAVERAKVELTFNRPIHVGFAILNLLGNADVWFSSQLHQEKVLHSTLLFTDADSLAYQIQTDILHEDFYADKHLFDFSDYEKESPFYDDENKTSNR